MTWERMTLSDVAAGGVFSDGDWVESKDQDASGTVRLTQLADVGIGTFRNRSNRWLREDQAARLNCTFLEANDILVARMPDPIGRACLVPEGADRWVTVVDVAILRVRRSDIDPRYVMWAINSPEFRENVASLQSGTTRKRISRKNLSTLSIPVPPLEEQRRVVATLEDHLSRLEAAEGYLGQALRGADTLRTVTLARLHEWPTTALASLARNAGYGTSEKCIVDGPGPAVVRIPNLLGGTIDLTDEKRIAASGVDVTKSMLSEGDLLIVRTNGSLDLIGRSAVTPADLDAAFASYLIRYRLRPEVVRPHWVHAMLSSPQLRRQIERLAASSAGQHNLSLGKLGSLPIPLPSLPEQDRLLDKFSSLEADRNRLTTAIASTRSRSAVLRRAVLAAAFSGRLTGSSMEMSEVAGMPDA